MAKEGRGRLGGAGGILMRVAVYVRVSKALDQNPETQLLPLREWMKRLGHEVVGEYVDEISSRDTRPKKEEVLRMLRRREIEGVAVAALDRWGRTNSELAFELEEFARDGVGFLSYKEAIDLSTAAGRLFANMLAVFANFERDRIQERTLLGIARARALGKPIGKRGPDKRPRKKRGIP